MKRLIGDKHKGIDTSLIIGWLPVDNELLMNEIKSFKCIYCKGILAENKDMLECLSCHSVYKLFNNKVYEAVTKTKG